MKLALSGDAPVRDVRKHPWPRWPVWDDGDRARLERVLDSGIWSYNGPSEREALAVLRQFFGVPHVVLGVNGTATLQLALEALDVGFGDEVIVPSLTWQATAAAALDVNAVPVLVDIDPETWCVDPAAIEAAITPRTRAIAPVHLYGAMANMDEIMRIAARHRVAVVEDTAHQHGSEWREKKAGTIGDIGSYSLQLSKVLTTGEGGILATRSRDLWVRLEALRNCGRRPEGAVADEEKGGGQYGSEGDLIQSGNYRITDLQAALLIGALERLPEQDRRREENGRYIDGRLAEIPGITPIVPYAGQNRRSYFNYAFRYDAERFSGGGIPAPVFRDALSRELGIGFEACYEPLTDCSLYRPQTKRRYLITQEHWRAIDPRRFETPRAVRVFRHESVVVHHRVLLGDTADMDQIVEAIRRLEAAGDDLRSIAAHRSSAGGTERD